MLTGDPGQAVADHTLEVVHQFSVAAGHVRQERTPSGTLASGDGSADLGHAVGAFVGTHTTGAQIDHAARRVQEPDVRVPLIGGTGVTAVSARQALDPAHGAGCSELDCCFRAGRFERCVAADVAYQVDRPQRILGAPALAVPHQPLAPGGNKAPVVPVAAGEAERQRIFAAPDGFARRLCLPDIGRIFIRCVPGQLHVHARTLSDELGNVKPLGQCISCIPALRFVFGRVEDGARDCAGGKNGLRCCIGIAPAGLIAIRPDQDRLTLERRPVGFIHRRVGTMHRGGGADACLNQSLRALLALDQHHRSGLHHPLLVVERARIGWCHLAPLRIPGPELLALAWRVVAVDHGDEAARGIQIVPLGGRGPQFVHRRRRLCPPGWLGH